MSISRRDFLKLAAPALLTPVLPGCNILFNKKNHPNVLFILVDDMSPKELGCYGNKEHKTPNIDQLAASGAQFNSCWATPLCMPSRAELMTGRYGFTTGHYHNAMRPDIAEGVELPDKHLVMPIFFKANNYRTTVVGKWQVSGRWQKFGFNDAYLYLDDGETESGEAKQYWDPMIKHNGERVEVKDDDFGPELMVDYLIKRIAEKTPQKNFYYYSSFLIHRERFSEEDKHALPVLPGGGDHPKDQNVGTVKEYVEYLDKLVGKIVAGLKESNKLDQTIIVLTSDNASLFHGKNSPISDRGPHVPLIMTGPSIKPNLVTDELIDFSDIFPTLIELCNLDFPSNYKFDGHSFARFLRGGEQPMNEWIYSYIGECQFIRNKEWLIDGKGNFYNYVEQEDCVEANRIDNPLDDSLYKVNYLALKKQLDKLPKPSEDIIEDAERIAKICRINQQKN